MTFAHVNKTVDLNYKAGYVECACKWRKTLGDGFNGYLIDNCPNCTPKLVTHVQDMVTTGRRGNYKIEHGRFVYFTLDNGIWVQYSACVARTEFRRSIPD